MDKGKAKQEIIKRYLSEGISTRKLGVEYGYPHNTIARWIMAYKKHGKDQSLSLVKDFLKEEPMPTDIKELQQALRLSRLRVDLLEATIDISDEQFGTAIRKKAGTSRS